MFTCKIPILEIGKKKLLSDISFDLKEGVVCSLLGKNGAGKTTLLRQILAADGELSGSFILDDKKLTSLTVRERARYVSHLGSSDFSKPDVGVIQFIKMCDEFLGNSTSLIKENEYLELLQFWRITHLEQVRVSRLSQGEFQRLLLASVFMQEVPLYVLDEPETHLDPEGMCLLKEMCSLKKGEGKIVLLATHDVNFAVSVSDFLIGLDRQGEQRFFNETKYCLEQKMLDRLYGVSFQVVRTELGEVQGVLTTGLVS